ncbi:MAG: flagellar biosynthesis anti-sigma factor FlgM [Burkholderiaceae bacterium]|nr:flagellar biosynthesis anti-sigma factor FlgM [Burkholderiaceae bacterium]
MKIGNPAEKPAAPAAATTPAAQSAPRTAAEAGAAPQATEASAQVALSSAATKLLSGDAGVSGDFDSEKVERISIAIEKGEYKINAEAIADKLIANAAEVLNSTPSKT